MGDLMDKAPSYFGFVPRGAVAEPGVPDFGFSLNAKDEIWADNVLDLYEQAKESQWNASTDIPWSELPELPDELEWAVCQVMTFLAENEYSALYIPAKFMAKINPHYIWPKWMKGVMSLTALAMCATSFPKTRAWFMP